MSLATHTECVRYCTLCLLKQTKFQLREYQILLLDMILSYFRHLPSSHDPQLFPSPPILAWSPAISVASHFRMISSYFRHLPSSHDLSAISLISHPHMILSYFRHFPSSHDPQLFPSPPILTWSPAISVTSHPPMILSYFRHLPSSHDPQLFPSPPILPWSPAISVTSHHMILSYIRHLPSSHDLQLFPSPHITWSSAISVTSHPHMISSYFRHLPSSHDLQLFPSPPILTWSSAISVTSHPLTLTSSQLNCTVKFVFRHYVNHIPADHPVITVTQSWLYICTDCSYCGQNVSGNGELVEGQLIKFVCSRHICAFRLSCSLIIVVWF